MYSTAFVRATNNDNIRSQQKLLRNPSQKTCAHQSQSSLCMDSSTTSTSQIHQPQSLNPQQVRMPYYTAGRRRLPSWLAMLELAPMRSHFSYLGRRAHAGSPSPPPACRSALRRDAPELGTPLQWECARWT